jgi:ribosomal-protein-serine acetyltransferase
MEPITIYRSLDYDVRPLRFAEAGALYQAVRASLPEVGAWESWCIPTYSMRDSEAFVAMCAANWSNDVDYGFGIVEPLSGRVLGTVAINQINNVHRLANLGYWTRTGETGRGIATQAARAVARFAFERLALTRLEIVVQVDNAPSRRVAEKVGARFECVARHRLVYHGLPREAAMYSLVPGDL